MCFEMFLSRYWIISGRIQDLETNFHEFSQKIYFKIEAAGSNKNDSYKKVYTLYPYKNTFLAKVKS